MKSKSIKGKSAAELKDALEQSVNDGFKPTLAIVLASIKQDRTALQKVFSSAGIAVFGATSNGSFINEEVDIEGASVLLMDINPSYFIITINNYPDKNFREVARNIAQQTLEKFQHPAFIIAGSHVETDAEQLLYGFADVVGDDVNIHGCMAGDDFTFSEQFVFTNEEESSQGVVTLAFDEDKIAIQGCATCGWHAVGTAKTVTKSEGNHVYTVDNIPVLDLTAKYGGIDLTNTNSLPVEIAAQLPLQLQREKGDPVMRPGLRIDWNDHSFYCSGAVPEGSKIRFSLPPDFDVIDKVVQRCESLKTNAMPEADALIIFSCAGRFITLGPLINEEIAGTQKVWNVPMAGMFSNAELARANGGNLEMHNLTTCVVALKEK